MLHLLQMLQGFLPEILELKNFGHKKTARMGRLYDCWDEIQFI